MILNCFQLSEMHICRMLYNTVHQTQRDGVRDSVRPKRLRSAPRQGHRVESPQITSEESREKRHQRRCRYTSCHNFQRPFEVKIDRYNDLKNIHSLFPTISVLNSNLL